VGLAGGLSQGQISAEWGINLGQCQVQGLPQVGPLLIMYDQRKTDESMILQKINEIDENLPFKMSTESNNTINYLDMLIYRNSRNINIFFFFFFTRARPLMPQKHRSLEAYCATLIQC
jgi:hypothetical protein